MSTHQSYRRKLKASRKKIHKLQAQIRKMQEQKDKQYCAPVLNTAQPPSCVYVYESEFLVIQKEAEAYPNLETGGFLFGWHKDGCPIVTFATGPGERAVHEVTQFRADVKASSEITDNLNSRGLVSLGSWHSHHRLGLCSPSATDCGVMIESLKYQDSILCGITNVNEERHAALRMYSFNRESGERHQPLPIKIIKGSSPIRRGLEHEFSL